MKFPWDKVEREQGFFIPALDLAPLREAGLLAALRLQIKDARARYVIMQGQLGVLFYRGPSAPKSRFESWLA